MKNGAALVVIDPRRTSLAKQPDVHLALRPGTDVAVALAIHRFLFECGFADEAFLAEHTHGVGKVDLFPEALDRDAPAGLYVYQGDSPAETYPLVLLSPVSDKTITSTLGKLRPCLASLQVHPIDAEARDLGIGDVARVFNTLGEIHYPVTLNPNMKPWTVGLPKGLWRKSTLNGSNPKALVVDTLTDLGGGACLNDAGVEVTRVVTAELEGRNSTLCGLHPRRRSRYTNLAAYVRG